MFVCKERQIEPLFSSIKVLFTRLKGQRLPVKSINFQNSFPSSFLNMSPRAGITRITEKVIEALGPELNSEIQNFNLIPDCSSKQRFGRIYHI